VCCGPPLEKTIVMKGQRVDPGLLEWCPALGDYEKSLLRRVDVEGRKVTEVAEEDGRAKSTVSARRKKALRKYREWVGGLEAGVPMVDVDAVLKSLQRVAPSIPELRKDLAEIHSFKARRDRAKAEYEAKRLKKRLMEEALEYEARLNPGKLITYVDGVLGETVIYRDFHKWCKRRKLSPEDACAEATERHMSFEEWIEDKAAEKPRKRPEFVDYVQDLLGNWIYMSKMEALLEEYSDTYLDPNCPRCGTRLKIEEPLTDFTCPRCLKTYHFFCPVCEELDHEKTKMMYRPKEGTFQCRWCGLNQKVEPEGNPFPTLSDKEYIRAGRAFAD